MSLKYGNYENKYILAKFQEWTGQSYEDYIKANPEFAPDNVKTFRQFIKGLKEKLFGKENNSGVLMASIAILPLPDFAKRFLTGGPTFTRKQKVAQAEIERAFDDALLQTQRVLAEDNTQAAMVLFMENLKDNIDNTTYISNIKKQEVIKTTQEYIQAKYDAAQQEFEKVLIKLMKILTLQIFRC